MNFRSRIIIIFLSFFILKCDNSKEGMESNKVINQEAQTIENEKDKHQKTIDSLNKEIIELNKTKLTLEKKEELASAELYNIVKKAYLDHIIIGTKDIQNSIVFFEDKLGFEIKKGKDHNNGLKNYFIEFNDKSEIEIMSIQKPNDNLAFEYESLINKDQYAFQFAIRTNQLSQLKNHLSNLSENFTEFYETESYSILSKKRIDPKFPFFFIQHHKENHIQSNHTNNSSGISSIWLETKNIKSTVRKYIEFGFTVLDTLTVGDYTGKTVLLKNENFELIIIDSNQDKICGITIKIKNISEFLYRIKEKLNIESKIKTTSRGRSIFLNPDITKSIWFEFIEN